ncbi:MAG: radical SAM protein [Deltaproteobacteria bacterium]
MRIIGRCNFRCPACSTFSSPEREGILRIDHFRQIVQTLAREDFQGVVNLSGGEPTLHPKLATMIRYVSETLPRARIIVFTNGSWIGQPWWRRKLESLMAGPNVLIRFSLDRQHAEGALKASARSGQDGLREIERVRFEQARAFQDACVSLGAEPGVRFDFAFKGTMDEARAYMASLGTPPVYLITFQKKPAQRTKKFGYFAIDIDSRGRASVYPTLGHIPRGEAIGGIEELPTALRMNRSFLKLAGE